MPGSENDLRSFRISNIKDIGEFVFAAVLAVYGVFGYYLLRDQWRVMQQQTRLMQHQTQVMERQLTDAERSAVESDKTTERQLRILENQATSLQAMATANKQQAVVAAGEAESLRSQAESLHTQVDSLQRQVAAMTSQAESLRAVAEANRTMAGAASVNAEAAQRVALTSAQQLEITDRAWIQVTPSATGPVEFMAIESGSRPTPREIATANSSEDRETIAVYTTARLWLTNTGRSVATDVRTSSILMFGSPRISVDASERFKQMTTTMCKSAVELIGSSNTLFPGDKIPQYVTDFQPISPADIAPSVAVSGRKEPSVELFLVGCTTYRFGNSSVVHHTWFTHRIGKRTEPKRQPFETWSFVIGKQVRPQDLFFEKWLYGGNGAD